jgi:hypothetical protein
MQKIVFIGVHMDIDDLRKKLIACLTEWEQQHVLFEPA